MESSTDVRETGPPPRIPSRQSLPPSRRSVSFVGGYHPDADRHDSDDERQPLLTQDGQRRTKRKLSALFNSRRQEGLELPGPFHRRYGEEEERSWRSVVGIAICIIAVLSVIVAAAVVVADNPMSGGAPHHSPSGRHPSYLIHAAHGAVASEASTCSNVGVKILKDGGNAVDAAIAANLCVGVVNMFSTGIGGGGFMTIMIPHERHVWTVDFRETAPAASNSTMFLKDPLSSIWGGLSVGVPGELRGMAEAHSRWGKLPWRRLFQESIKLAEGFAATRVLEDRLRGVEDFMINDPDWAPIFAPTGRLVRRGEIIKRTNYSRTLKTIADQGHEAFYSGRIADSILKKIKDTGGVMTHRDLISYKPIVRPALEGTYQGNKELPPRRIYTTHAPTSGPVVLHILNLLEGYNFTAEGPTPLNVHRTVEALKFGFAARTRLADPAFLNGSNPIADIPTKAYARRIFANITDDTTHEASYYHPVYDVPEDHGTTHTSVYDEDGMVVALTSTINLVWGSRLMDSETGIILNDEMDDFSKPGRPNFFGLRPSPYNYPAPGKRPLSSIAPTIITEDDGSFFLALGGSGGSLIFPSIVQTILNVDWGMDIRQAIERPRVYDQLFPWTVRVETGYHQAAIDGLSARGHNITMFNILDSIAAIQAVMKREGRITAASDSRKYGVAAGY